MSVRQLPVFYACDRCPAYCCSYPRIVVKEDDIDRLAEHFGIDRTTARRRFTKRGWEPGERVLRHQWDEIFESVCRFLDRGSRRCKIYEARPTVCRDYPNRVRCGYYDFLAAERQSQEDREYIATTDHRDLGRRP